MSRICCWLLWERTTTRVGGEDFLLLQLKYIYTECHPKSSKWTVLFIAVRLEFLFSSGLWCLLLRNLGREQCVSPWVKRKFVVLAVQLLFPSLGCLLDLVLFICRERQYRCSPRFMKMLVSYAHVFFSYVLPAEECWLHFHSPHGQGRCCRQPHDFRLHRRRLRLRALHPRQHGTWR